MQQESTIRPLRFIAYMLAGFAVAAVLARLFQPHYLSLCNAINVQPGADCRPISVQAMIGLFVIALGLISMIVVPIVSSLWQLLQHGHKWETPRGTETAATNLPILAGFIYLASGAVVAIAGY